MTVSESMVAAAYAEVRAPAPAPVLRPRGAATTEEKVMALSQMIEAGFIAGDLSYYDGDVRNT